jgi:hypothetical protein
MYLNSIKTGYYRPFRAGMYRFNTRNKINVRTIGKVRENTSLYLYTQDNDSENGTTTVNKRGLSPTD